ncbi:MAG: hypothetical protein ABSC76_06980 [Terracidiphilus sp.]|jgi:hypothetical protein
MYTIAQSQMLLRTRTELPDGLKLATEEFCEDWSFVRSANALRIGKQIIMRGWSFVCVADGSLRSGVGDTSQEAIGGALKLALRHIGPNSNAAEVEHIQLTPYPWFFLARVKILPYCIQPGATLPVYGESESVRSPRRRTSRPIGAEVLYPRFGGAMPQLKQMLISSGSASAKSK